MGNPFVHVELQTQDLGKAKKFYQGLFDWKLEDMLGKREIGHIHGDSLVDIPLPKKVRDELVSTGRAEPHHVLPKSGWVSVYCEQRLMSSGR